MEWYLCGIIFLGTVAGSIGRLFGSELRFEVNDESGNPLPCRLHLADSNGKVVNIPGFPAWNDHVVIAGRAEVSLPAGRYSWALERGPETIPAAGVIDVADEQPSVIRQVLRRLTNMNEDGWYSADLHVHRPLDEMPMLMEAEDLNYAAVITWWNRANPWMELPANFETVTHVRENSAFDVMGGEDERGGGALLFFGLKRPLRIQQAEREFPSSVEFIRESEVMNPKVWIDAEKPFWWDFPLWLTSGRLNSVGIAHNHMHRTGVLDNEAWGRPRDLAQYPGPHGNGLWTQDIYYKALNAGFRLPPSAGSASGVLPNPVGHNRVYAQVNEEFTPERWFESFAAGHVFVTNGPLLVSTVNESLPGEEFAWQSNKESYRFDVQLSSNHPLQSVELIHNGNVVRSVAVAVDEENKQARITFTHKFDSPGWFLLRTVATDRSTFRFASSAPWYFNTASPTPELQELQHESAIFFLNWTDQRIASLKRVVEDPVSLSSVLGIHQKSQAYWLNQIAETEDSVEGVQALTDSQRRLRRLGTSLLHALGKSDDFNSTRSVRGLLKDVESRYDLAAVLAPSVLGNVQLNPESRVKIHLEKERIAFAPQHPQRYLIHIENLAGSTAPMEIRARDLADKNEGTPDWMRLRLLDLEEFPNQLSGAEEQYMLIELEVFEQGLFEVRLVAEAGQGTQDLGFRASSNVLIDTRPRR